MRPLTRLLAGLLLSAPALAPAAAEPLDVEAAQRFVMGRTFSYTCYEGTSGFGQIQKDGSVAGFIQVKGKGNVRYVTLPAGTILVKGEAVCAKLKNVMFQPCFELEKTGDKSFRGNLAGADRMWCRFDRAGNGRSRLAARKPGPANGEVATAQMDDKH